MTQKVKLHLPFDDQWYVFWGGDTEKLNRHHDSSSQKYAFDFVYLDPDDPERSFQTNGTSNEDYFAFGKTILSPAGGTVVEAVSTVRDNLPGQANPFHAPGNFVMIQHTASEFSLLCHLAQNSLRVKQGDEVRAKQIVGQCGNSGMSSQPHLHYHLQTSGVFFRYGKKMQLISMARGIKPYFEKVMVERGGNMSERVHYSPIKGDFVSNT